MRERYLSGLGVFWVCFMIVVLAGCATTQTRANEEGPGEVMGSAPTGADAEFHAPPRGPEVLRPKHGGEQDVDGEVASSGVIQRAALNGIIERGPGYVLSQVETKPALAGQKFVGFELVGMSPAAERVVGTRVRVGDVVTHLNGVQQRSPEDYLRAWNKLVEAQSVQIDLVRDGESERVIWRVE